MNGRQPGDPDKAAAAILQALSSSTPPLRLALGSDAIESIGGVLDARRAELDRWSALSLSTARCQLGLRRTERPAAQERKRRDLLSGESGSSMLPC
jgi:hypothetical protein